MIEWLMILLTIVRVMEDGTGTLAAIAAIAAATWAFRRAGYRRHLRRIAEIEHPIALRAGSAA